MATLSITDRGRVPVAWRQLAAEPGKLAVSVAAVAAAVALVLLLTGLRRGMGEQVTLYVDRQAPVLVGQEGARNFLSQSSVLPEELGSAIEDVPGVAGVAPISQQYAMLRLHDRRVLALLVGYDLGKSGGPWELSSGRVPRAEAEIARLEIVGLSNGTSRFMTPLAFATHEQFLGDYTPSGYDSLGEEEVKR
jgi:putative ABC transport system permease protein